MALLEGPEDCVFRGTIDTTGDVLSFSAPAWKIQVSNVGGNELRVFFREADFDDDVKYIDLASSTGYLEYERKTDRIWLKANGGDTDVIVLVAFK